MRFHMAQAKVTVDNFDIQTHRQYALNQERFDATYVTDAPRVAPQVETEALSLIYASKWKTLFEIDKSNSHWALFCAPPAKPHLNYFLPLKESMGQRMPTQRLPTRIARLVTVLVTLQADLSYIYSNILRYQKG